MESLESVKPKSKRPRGRPVSDKRKQTFLHVRLFLEDKELLERAAAKRGKNVTEMVETMIKVCCKEKP